MDPGVLKSYLATLCEDMDNGAPLRVVRWAGAALVATGALVACGEPDDTDVADQGLYGAPFEEACDDDVDNDDDELVDCEDDDCVDDPACAVVEAYEAPPA